MRQAHLQYGRHVILVNLRDSTSTPKARLIVLNHFTDSSLVPYIRITFGSLILHLADQSEYKCGIADFLAIESNAAKLVDSPTIAR